MKQVIGTAEVRSVRGCYEPDFKEVTLRSSNKDFGITMVITRMRTSIIEEMEMKPGEFYDVTLESVVKPTKGSR